MGHPLMSPINLSFNTSSTPLQYFNPQSSDDHQHTILLVLICSFMFFFWLYLSFYFNPSLFNNVTEYLSLLLHPFPSALGPTVHPNWSILYTLSVPLRASLCDLCRLLSSTSSSLLVWPSATSVFCRLFSTRAFPTARNLEEFLEIFIILNVFFLMFYPPPTALGWRKRVRRGAAIFQLCPR